MDLSKWNACAMDPHQWMRLIECHPGFAAYLQAIFSVIAIFVAIAVPAYMTHSENTRRAKERVIHARNIIAAAAPDVFSIWGRSSKLKKTITRLRVAPSTIGDPHASFPGLKIQVSQVIQRLLTPTTEADPATLQPLNQLAMHVTAYNNLIDNLTSSLLAGGNQWNPVADQLVANLEMVIFVSSQLIKHYEAMAADTKGAMQ